MGLYTSHADRLALAVTASVTAILAQAAEARQNALDRRLQPMREVIDALEDLHGPDARPLDHPGDFADLVARHGADHLRERDVQLLQAATAERADRDCALGEALDDLAAARAASGEVGRQYDDGSLLAWVGVSKEQFQAVVDMALRRPSPS